MAKVCRHPGQLPDGCPPYNNLLDPQGDPNLNGKLPLGNLRGFLDLSQKLQFVVRRRAVGVELFIG